MWKLSLVLLAAALLPSCGGGGGGGGGSAAKPPTGTPAGDTTPPLVLTTNPASSTSGVPTNATLSATFSEAVNVPAGAFTVTEIPWRPALLGTSGQITRLTFGDGCLWLFTNPNFQKVDPTTGAILMTYCKTDGGANLLFFNHLFWTIKDTTLLAYSLN